MLVKSLVSHAVDFSHKVSIQLCRSEDDISVFVHFPPNIFRLHVHFVSANRTAQVSTVLFQIVQITDLWNSWSEHFQRTMWAPPDEVFLLKKLVKSLWL